MCSADFSLAYVVKLFQYIKMFRVCVMCKFFDTCGIFQCFVYHLHTGVRAGGGIGDEIEPADGDAYEIYRILFDISFFFFVIVILLAIIQGR